MWGIFGLEYEAVWLSALTDWHPVAGAPGPAELCVFSVTEWAFSSLGDEQTSEQSLQQHTGHSYSWLIPSFTQVTHRLCIRNWLQTLKRLEDLQRFLKEHIPHMYYKMQTMYFTPLPSLMWVASFFSFKLLREFCCQCFCLAIKIAPALEPC